MSVFFNASSSSKHTHAGNRCCKVTCLVLTTTLLLRTLPLLKASEYESREAAHEAFGNGPVRLLDPDDEPPIEAAGHGVDQYRVDAIKQATMASWTAYRRYAWGHDELKPVSRSYMNWNREGAALTAVDALSTLWIMGFRNEFDDAVELLTKNITWNALSSDLSVFEMTIRLVGGLLSAYELTLEDLNIDQGKKAQYAELLKTARTVSDILMHAHNTPSGIPSHTINMHTGEHWGATWTNGSAILSEFGSCQLEFRTLSYHTQDPYYDIHGTHINNVLLSKCAEWSQLCPVWWSSETAEPTRMECGFGSFSDSYYEYMMKQYILTGRTEAKYRNASLYALNAGLHHFRASTEYYAEDNITQKTRMYWTDVSKKTEMEHLDCFVGGMYALAARTVPNFSLAEEFIEVGNELTDTCIAFYDENLYGISPDSVNFSTSVYPGFVPVDEHYQLRPELLESIFYMWRTTHDSKWRATGWRIFRSILSRCQTEESWGFTGLRDVHSFPTEWRKDDQQHTFWIAETLKYLFLLFSDDSMLSLDEWVLNTEAHPFRIHRRDPLDVWRAWEDAHGGTPRHFPPTVENVTPVETEAMKRIRSVRAKECDDDLVRLLTKDSKIAEEGEL